jgi:putrescine carbamoyltransferase
MINHFIDVNDVSKKEILEIIELASLFKKARKANAIPPILAGKSVAMIFELPSSRTRVSFENATTLLGGHALYLKPGEIHVIPRESLEDTTKVLSHLCDGIVIRAWKHETVKIVEQFASVPVFNGLTNYNHPTQALADIMTIMEHTDKELENIVLTFVGDRTNVCNSLLNISMKLGITFRQIAPKKFQLKKEVIGNAQSANPTYKKPLIITDAVSHVKGSDFIYTDLWWWIDQEVERDLRKAVFYPKYQVNKELLLKTKNKNVKFLHCLPANREMEVTSEVLDGESSLAFKQAENRLYIQMALLSHYIHQQKVIPSQETIQEFEDKICSKIKEMN